jgi:hypothetical protein
MVRRNAVRAPQRGDGHVVLQGKREHAVRAVVEEVEDVVCWLLGGLLGGVEIVLEGVGQGAVGWELVVIKGRGEGVGGWRGVERGTAEALGEGGGGCGNLAEDACKGVVVRDLFSRNEGV